MLILSRRVLRGGGYAGLPRRLAMRAHLRPVLHQIRRVAENLEPHE